MGPTIFGSHLSHLSQYAGVVRKPRKADGRNAPVRSCTLVYDEADKLTLCAGDGDAFLMAQLPVRTRGERFAVNVDRLTFVRAAAVFQTADSSVQLVPVKDVLGVTRKQFWLPLVRRNTYPCSPALLALGASATIDRAAFQNALGFAVTGGTSGPVEDDLLESRRLVCTVGADGAVHAAHNGVDVVGRGPQLGFEMSLRRTHAGQLCGWLGLLCRSAELWSEPAKGDTVEITTASTDSRAMFRFVHPSTGQTLLLPERSVRYPCQNLDMVTKPFDVQLRVCRQELQRATETIGRFGRDVRLQYRHGNETQRRLSVMADGRSEEPQAWGEVDVDEIDISEQASDQIEYVVMARDFAFAVRAVGGQHVVVALRRGRSAVTTSTDDELPVGERSRLACFRARRTE